MRLASVKVYKFSAIKDENEIQFAHLYFDRCANHYVHPHLLVEVQHCSLDKTQDLCCELTKSTVVFLYCTFATFSNKRILSPCKNMYSLFSSIFNIQPLYSRIQ